MSTDPATPPRGLAALDVLVPGSPGWDDARRAWNLTVDQRPDAVFMPGDAEEVAAAVRAAGAAGLRVAVQATGHGAGPRRNLEGTLLINTSRMRGASVDPASRTARVEAGAQWRDVGPLAAEHGLAALHGSAPDVGVVGYTLGGGVGWLSRRYGLAANSVTAIEVVTADGEAVRADADTEPDLFWALRGGGGNFGVVTALEFRLYPVESLNAGWLVWPWEEARRVLARWAEWTDTVPEEVTSVGRILQLPPLPDLPEAFRGRQLVVIDAAILADEDEAARLLAPLRELGPELDTFAQGPATALSELHMDPPEPVPAAAAGSVIDAFPPEAVDALVDVAGPGSGSPLITVELRHIGGALERAPAGAGALGRIDGRFLVFAAGIVMSPEAAPAVADAGARANAALSRWGAGRAFLNFADVPTDAETMFDPQAYRRLREIRSRVDPDGLLLANHPIPSA
ncbi:MAG: FAD-binding oxidoreductase [Thermoleophilia bacterium]